MVTWQDGSEVVRVTFKSHEPADAKRIVDAVQNAFMKEVVEKDVREKQIFLKKVEEAQLEDARDSESEGRRKANRQGAAPAAGGGDVIQAGGVLPKEGPAPAPAPAPGIVNPMAPLPPIVPGVPGIPGVPPIPPAAQPIDPVGFAKLVERDPRILVEQGRRIAQGGRAAAAPDQRREAQARSASSEDGCHSKMRRSRSSRSTWSRRIKMSSSQILRTSTGSTSLRIPAERHE